MWRRAFLRVSGAALTAGVAGCFDPDDGSDETGLFAALELAAIADSNAVDQWLRSNAIWMRRLSREKVLSTETPDDDIDELLAAYRIDMAARSAILRLHLVDTDTGTIEFSSDPTTVDTAVGHRPWFTDPRTWIHLSRLSILYLGDDTESAAIVRRIDDHRSVVAVYDMETVGVEILVGHSLQYTAADIDESYSTIVDARDRIVLHDSNAGRAVGGQYPEGSPALEAARQLDPLNQGSQEVPREYVPDSAGDTLVAYSHSTESDWIALVHAKVSGRGIE